MGIFDNYRPEEGTRITEGDHRVKIVEAKYKTSQSGKEGVSLKFVTRDHASLYMNVYEGEYFNRIMTNFYDGFKIPRGDRNLQSWIGRTGTAHVALGKPRQDGKQFMEPKYFIVEAPAAAPYGPPPQGAPAQPPAYQAPAHQAYQAPAQQSYQAQRQVVPAQDEEFVDDIPF